MKNLCFSKSPACVLVFIVSLLTSCSKPGDVAPVMKTDDFKTYNILKGKNFSEQSGFATVKTTEMKFAVRFDSSAIYATVDPRNQADINKLYGFADNGATQPGDHQKFSARFGWRWSDNSLRLFGYIYNNSSRQFAELEAITIGSTYSLSIKVEGDKYIFYINERAYAMPRESSTKEGVGYQLYPYFGGDEPSPKDIKIKIKDL